MAGLQLHFNLRGLVINLKRKDHIPTDAAALQEGLQDAGYEITRETGLGRIVAWIVETWDAYDHRRDYDYEALRPRAVAVQRRRQMEEAA